MRDIGNGGIRMNSFNRQEFRGTEVIHGDALRVLKDIPDNMFDGVITDPPYSSGGSTMSEKQQSTAKKYTNSKTKCPLTDFEGDSKDQRSWRSWSAEWLTEARRIAKDGAVCCVFSDWRQVPTLSDAMQWAGWIWRGVAIWDKVNSRPQKGRFRQQAEFVLWGSKGALRVDRPVPVLPGVFRHTPLFTNNRLHQAQKPLELMRELVRIVEPGGVILDPFAGSGTTLLAAKLEGYPAVGVEVVKEFAELGRERLVEVCPTNLRNLASITVAET